VAEVPETIYWEGRKIRRGGMTLLRLEPVDGGPVCWMGEAEFVFGDPKAGGVPVRFTYRMETDSPAEAFEMAPAAASAEQAVVVDRIKEKIRANANRIQVAGAVPPSRLNPFGVQ